MAGGAWLFRCAVPLAKSGRHLRPCSTIGQHTGYEPSVKETDILKSRINNFPDGGNTNLSAKKLAIHGQDIDPQGQPKA